MAVFRIDKTRDYNAPFLTKKQAKAVHYFSRKSFGVSSERINRLKMPRFLLYVSHTETFLFVKIPLLR